MLSKSCLDSHNGTNMDRTNSSKMAAGNCKQSKLISSWATGTGGSDYFGRHLFRNPQYSCVKRPAEPLKPVCVWSHVTEEEVWGDTQTLNVFSDCPTHVVNHCLWIISIYVNPVRVFFPLFIFFPRSNCRKAHIFKSLITCGAVGGEIIAYLWQQPASLKWVEQPYI